MAEQHLEKTLSDLLSQRDQKIAEITKLDAAIEAIQRLVGANSTSAASSINVSDSMRQTDGAHPILGVMVKPGDFFGRAPADAAQEYLRRRGSAASLDEIFSALQRGGANLKGKDPKKNLNMSLVKKRAIFAPVAPYTFGLWTFYPDAKRKRIGGETLIVEQLKEVMQDGKTHRMVEVIGLLEQKFDQKFSRSTVVSALHRGKEFRRVRRGMYKLKSA